MNGSIVVRRCPQCEADWGRTERFSHDHAFGEPEVAVTLGLCYRCRLIEIGDQVRSCQACSRLVAHCLKVAHEKKRAYRDQTYWGRPLPGFGDPDARLLVVGLAPAAHGGNRTGRMFTGDSSADWLIRAMHRTGFANQPHSTHSGDGLQLVGAYVTAAARCAPPDNKPTATELAACHPYLVREMQVLRHVKVILALGRIAFDAALRAMPHAWHRSLPPGSRPVFAHGARYELGASFPVLLASYHPSRQNTQTRRLTEEMFDSVFAEARQKIADLGRSFPWERRNVKIEKPIT